MQSPDRHAAARLGRRPPPLSRLPHRAYIAGPIGSFHPGGFPLADSVERRFGDLVVRVDRLLCVGFGDCIEVAPEVWEFDDEGIVTFRDPAAEIPRERLLTSCDICPVDALTVLDDAGAQLVP